ncbi:sigma-70 family RNA polymerase sigma factor [Brevibacillus ruminantium]|uniref:Sigma-70 family RNA polymerase sigma factor n=1 Tax=Brevibacillus ruminantium TaxID=2950604 RepID=A0ABY4WFK9_9BACL|nr:sigma-70 family RNA polymerase sigma factor [Brevibacillus ruminantium]USG64913.1 sigma-70 family RNA polymerase sigma factor [Brevibacillus ruminantium]
MTEDLEQRIRDIYQTYYEDVYSFLYYFTGRREDAEDMTQEVFTRLLKALPRYDGRVSMRTWLFSIARYAAIDQYRKQKLFSLFSKNELEDMKSCEGLPEQSLESKEEMRMVNEALQKLKPHYRMVVILRGVREHSIKETAELLNITEAKVRVDYHRALKMLQKSLGDEKGGVFGEFAR